MKLNPDEIPYITRTRDYYRAQGFTRDYKWAHHDTTPFTALDKPLADCIITVVTTAVAHPDIPKPIRACEHIPFSDTPDTFETSELSWDKVSTHTRDRQSYFPLEVLNNLTASGVIKGLSKHFHFVPTQYSHRVTTEQDAPAIAQSCLQDAADIALLVPL